MQLPPAAVYAGGVLLIAGEVGVLLGAGGPKSPSVRTCAGTFSIPSPHRMHLDLIDARDAAGRERTGEES